MGWHKGCYHQGWEAWGCPRPPAAEVSKEVHGCLVGLGMSALGAAACSSGHFLWNPRVASDLVPCPGVCAIRIWNFARGVNGRRGVDVAFLTFISVHLGFHVHVVYFPFMVRSSHLQLRLLLISISVSVHSTLIFLFLFKLIKRKFYIYIPFFISGLLIAVLF